MLLRLLAVVLATSCAALLAGPADALSQAPPKPTPTPSRQGDVVTEDVAWTQDGDGENGTTVVVVVCDHCGSVTFHDTCNDPDQASAACG